eukprot:8215545-Pyramimonas_sp.AAC.1
MVPNVHVPTTSDPVGMYRRCLGLIQAMPPSAAQALCVMAGSGLLWRLRRAGLGRMGRGKLEIGSKGMCPRRTAGPGQ